MASRWTRDLLELAKECAFTPYKSSGPGGQKKNKTESAVRVVHLPTGLTRIATESRSQSANRLHALERIAEALAARRRQPRPRRDTRPTAASRAVRRKEKAHRSKVKRLRQRPGEE
jgi:protein subunit release factor B